jgi:hypothetical protein
MSFLLSSFSSKDLVTGQTFGAITLINKHEFDIFTGGDEVVLSIFVRQVSTLCYVALSPNQQRAS